jgi:hypothetical protein
LLKNYIYLLFALLLVANYAMKIGEMAIPDIELDSIPVRMNYRLFNKVLYPEGMFENSPRIYPRDL